MEINQKIVMFDIWCPKCLYRKTPEEEDPCNECLNYPAIEDDMRPVGFKEEK